MAVFSFDTRAAVVKAEEQKMVHRGHIKNGMVVFDQPIELPDGTEVRIEPVTAGKMLTEQFAEAMGRVGDRAPATRHADSVLAFLDSLPTGPRAFVSWDEYENHLRQERDSWDR